MKSLICVTIAALVLGADCQMAGTLPAGNLNPGAGNAGTGNQSDWPQQARLTSYDPGGDDLYGDAVTANDTIIAVGSELKNSLIGVVDVFTLFAGEWRFIQRLEPGESRHPEQSFGSAVAVSNHYIFVGAQKYAIPNSFHIQRGAVYVFQNLGIQIDLHQVLTIPDAVDFEHFGNALAYEPNQSRLIVGAFGRKNLQGAAYVFAFNGNDFIFEDKLAASDGVNFDWFGSAVAVSGLTAVIGADATANGGAVYVFERNVNTWSQVQKIEAPDAEPIDHFGQSVAIDGNTMVAGAPGKKRPQDDLLRAGMVYIYEREGGAWIYKQTLVPEDQYAGLFGASVAIDNGVIAVGIEGKGRALLFEKNGDQWTMTAKIVPDPSGTVDSFGNAMALAGDTLLVGARSADAGGHRASGAAYVFSPPGANDGPNLPPGTRF